MASSSVSPPSILHSSPLRYHRSSWLGLGHRRPNNFRHMANKMLIEQQFLSELMRHGSRQRKPHSTGPLKCF